MRNLKHYSLTLLYYISIVVRGVLVVVLKPLNFTVELLYSIVSEWELDKPLRKSNTADEDEHLDYLNAEDPYYTKHHISVKRYTKKQHIKEQTHSVNILMRYSYNVYSGDGTLVEENLNSEEEAQTVIAHLRDAGVDTTDFTIQEQQHYTTTGLGRDPDLHQRSVEVTVTYGSKNLIIWLKKINYMVQKNKLFDSKNSIV